MYIGILHLTRKDSIFMIEPKDASTCDERRVKNKLNLLTHKKKGETHTMGISRHENLEIRSNISCEFSFIGGAV